MQNNEVLITDENIENEILGAIEDELGVNTSTSVEPTSPTSTEPPKQRPIISKPNRAQRRQVWRQKLTKPIKKIRGKVFYGETDITNYVKLGFFTHAYTIMKVINMSLSPKDLLDMKKEQEEKEADNIKEAA